MRWIVTFLDTVVILYFLSGIAIWRNAFPEYMRSEHAEKFSENGLDIILLVNIEPIPPFQWLHFPNCTYDISIKKQGSILYRHFLRGSFGEGNFGWNGCSKEIMTFPDIHVFKTKNNPAFIYVYREKQAGFEEDRFELYELPTNNRDSFLSLRLTPTKKDSSLENANYSDEDLLKMYYDNRLGISCEVTTPDTTFFNDTTRVRALYDAFAQMWLKPDCIDSLTQEYAKPEQN